VNSPEPVMEDNSNSEESTREELSTRPRGYSSESQPVKKNDGNDGFLAGKHRTRPSTNLPSKSDSVSVPKIIGSRPRSHPVIPDLQTRKKAESDPILPHQEERKLKENLPVYELIRLSSCGFGKVSDTLQFPQEIWYTIFKFCGIDTIRCIRLWSKHSLNLVHTSTIVVIRRPVKILDNIDSKNIFISMLNSTGEELSQMVINYPFNQLLKGYQYRAPIISKSTPSQNLVEELCSAAFEGNSSKIKTMLKKHPDLLNMKNKNGQSCLYCASRAGKVDLVKELLEIRGVDSNSVVELHGSTPLHAASFGGHASTVSLLLSYGADHEIKNAKGLTAKDEASSPEVRNVWQLFREGSLEKSPYPISKIKINLEQERQHNLLHYLIKEKSGLSLEAKVHLIVNLQKLGKECIPDEYLWQVIDSVQDAHFKRFKTAVDNISDQFNMYNLYYRVLSEKYMQLFMQKVKSAHQTAESVNKRPVKILSDIDDTFICSGGTFGNVDTRYPKDVIYPGVNAFYRELDLGPYAQNGDWPKDRFGNLAFVTARPHVDAAEMSTYEKFSICYSSGHLYTFPTLLCGNFKGLTGAPFGNFKEMSRKKFKNFQQYLVLYPEYDFVFIGDNGQGDALTAATMLKEYPDRVKAVFIHQVHNGTVFGQTDAPEWGKIHYFNNYVDAAIKAYENKLIHFKGLLRIISTSRREFDTIKWQNAAQKKKATEIFELSCSKGHKIVVRAAKLNKVKASNHRTKKENNKKTTSNKT
jgi:hypothetical protein